MLELSHPRSEQPTSVPVASQSVVVGISGARQNAAVAVCVDGAIRAHCEQERVTRVRRVGLPRGSFPSQALDVALRSAGVLTPDRIRTYVTAEAGVDLPADLSTMRMDHHHAHAATAAALSTFDQAAVLVCDRHGDRDLSVWVGTGPEVTRQEWPKSAAGFAALYSECGLLFGFARGQEHELEALARLDAVADSDRFSRVLTYSDGVLHASPHWRDVVVEWLKERHARRPEDRAVVARSFQEHIGRLVLDFANDIRRQTNQTRLCLAGGLFYNTYFTTLLRQSGIFDDVFTTPNPGNAGTAIGAALAGTTATRWKASASVSPFLGPEYDAEDIKRTLDNCKLSYEYLAEEQVITTTVDALLRGHLVGWFQGRMEWGHRALGNRSILASPLLPHVLDNLNVYLKHRDRHRAYGVSVPAGQSPRFFSGPPQSRFMEHEYRPHDPELFRHVMPLGTRSIRVQTVPALPDDGSSARYGRLHEAFGQASGVPVLVNTSFNGFSEPMVCSPRDAIRVFFGTGLDLLVLDRFVIRK